MAKDNMKSKAREGQERKQRPGRARGEKKLRRTSHIETAHIETAQQRDKEK